MTIYQIGWFSSICLLLTWFSDLYITKNCIFCWYTIAENIFFQSLNHVDNLKPGFLIKSGYYIVPSPSTPLITGLHKMCANKAYRVALLHSARICPSNGLLLLILYAQHDEIQCYRIMGKQTVFPFRIPTKIMKNHK